MKIFIENANKALGICLNVLRWNGILMPEKFTGIKKMLVQFYTYALLMYVVGIFIIIQMGELIQVWGDISLMTAASFLMFLNLTHSVKVFNVMYKRDVIQALIDEGDHALRSEGRTKGKDIVKRTNQDATRLLYIYAWGTAVTVVTRVAGAEKGNLPYRAWYPYDVTKSPVFELTYMQQTVGAIVIGFVHVTLDVLVTSLTSVCRCRLQLLGLSLKTICNDIPLSDKHLISPEQEKTVFERLRVIVKDHQAILQSADTIQSCFGGTILVQFTVSMITICVSAYQLAVGKNTGMIQLIAIITYLFDMVFQVFIYCYEGHYLMEESEDIANAAYESLWYTCSVPVKRTLLNIMTRSRRACILTAGGFTTLSLDCFVSIIKASYSFFTVLMQMEE